MSWGTWLRTWLGTGLGAGLGARAWSRSVVVRTTLLDVFLNVTLPWLVTDRLGGTVWLWRRGLGLGLGRRSCAVSWRSGLRARLGLRLGLRLLGRLGLGLRLLGRSRAVRWRTRLRSWLGLRFGWRSRSVSLRSRLSGSSHGKGGAQEGEDERSLHCERLWVEVAEG